MLLRLWAFLASAPLGVLGALAWPRDASALGVGVAAVVAGAVGAVLATLAARVGDEAPDREAHVARGVGVGLSALPPLVAGALRLGPPAWVWLAVVAAAFVFALWRASRASTAGPTAGELVGSLLLVLLLATAVTIGIAVGYGALAPPSPDPDPALRAAALDIDSRVALRAPRHCGPRLSASVTLTTSGAAPRLASDGETLWFEARTDDGRFQIERRDPSGRIVCWTCAEAGNNRRPAPHPYGVGVLFDTDRFASWQRPGDTEIMLATARGDDKPHQAARRLTNSPGRDDHALYDPSGAGLLWSRGGSGGFEVLRASILGGHGGMLLSEPVTLLRGRASWLVPLAWSPDARTLVAGLGQPLSPLFGLRLDPGSGERGWIDGGLLAGSVSFASDGQVMAIAATRAEGALRLVPSALGNVLARWPALPEPRGSGTQVLLGDPRGTLAPLELGELADWGVPTGIALLPDANGFVLGQRGAAGERIVRVTLACAE